MNSSAATRTILFLAANPKDTGRLRLDEEVREIQEGLQLAVGRDLICFETQWAIRLKDLRRSLLKHTPQIVHFAGHGAGTEGLVLEDDAGYTQCIQAETLARLFKLCPTVQCVVLNACYSQVQAAAIAQHVPYVIGMNQAIADDTAIKFAVGFYDALGYGRSLSDAYEFGMTAIEAEPSFISRDIAPYPEDELLTSIADAATPILIQAAANTGILQPVFPNLQAPPSNQQERQDRLANAISRKEYHWRRVLLNKVKNIWIDGLLNNLLEKENEIELAWEDRKEFILNPASGLEEFSSSMQQNFPEGTTAIDIFEQMGEGKNLLILGQPGAGKTVTLLRIAEALISKAQKDISGALPVILNLSSWAKQRKAIDEWLVQELYEFYGTMRELGKSWIEQGQLILLLDGLDEVDVRFRDDCIEALNQFIQEYGSSEIIVCSRIANYRNKLKLQKAIAIKPLTDQQITGFLEQSNKQLATLKHALTQDNEFQRLLSTPLTLNIISKAYENNPVNIILQSNGSKEAISQIFDAYIKRMLQRKYATSLYSRKITLHWLIFLARQMEMDSQSIFLIENMQPKVLRKVIHRSLYLILSVFGIGLSLGLLSGLIQGANATFRHGFLAGFLEVLINSFACGSILGIAVVLYEQKIRPVETLKFTQKGLKGALVQGLKLGLFCGPLSGFVYGVIAGIVWRWDGGFAVGLSDGFLAGIILGLVIGFSIKLKGPEIERKVRPNQGIWRSLKNTIYSTIFGGLLGTLLGFFIYGIIVYIILGPIVERLPYLSLGGSLLKESIYGGRIGLASGMLGGFIGSGGPTCIKHLALRSVLWQCRLIPWNYARFLDFCCDRLLLQRVGGGYIFIHRSLMEHFAQLEPES